MQSSLWECPSGWPDVESVLWGISWGIIVLVQQEPSQWLANSNLASLAASVRTSSDQMRQQSPNNGSPWVSPSMPRRENLPPAPPLPPRRSLQCSPPLPRWAFRAHFFGFLLFFLIFRARQVHNLQTAAYCSQRPHGMMCLSVSLSVMWQLCETAEWFEVLHVFGPDVLQSPRLTVLDGGTDSLWRGRVEKIVPIVMYLNRFTVNLSQIELVLKSTRLQA